MTGIALIRVADFWDQLKTYLNSDDVLAQILQGPSRVFKLPADSDAANDPILDAGDVWGRVVIVPTQNIWGDNVQSPDYRQLSFLVRCEVNDSVSIAADSSYILEGAHARILELLQGWAPELDGAHFSVPVYLNAPPQVAPLWDDGRELWFTSAEYRGEVRFKIPL